MQITKKTALDIIDDIPRLIPYSYNNDLEKLEFKNRDGLLEYQKRYNLSKRRL